MKFAALSAAVALALAGPAAAAGLCLLPLEGGEPVNEIEREQPWRIIGQSRAFEGFPLVLVDPTNRGYGDIMTVRGMRFEPFGGDFPKTLMLEEITPPRADGSIWGLGRRPRGFYRAAPGADEFVLVPGTDEARSLHYDPAEDRAMMLGRNAVLYEVGAEGIVPSPLGGLALDRVGAKGFAYPEGLILPRFIAPLGVHLAADGDQQGGLWLRGADGGWRQLDHGGPIHQAWQVTDAPWHRDPAEGIATLMIGRVGLVFDARAPGEGRLLYRFEMLGGGAFPEGQRALIWEAPEPQGWLAWMIGLAPALPQPAWVTRQGLLRLPAGELVSEFSGPPRRHSPGVAGLGVYDLPEFGVTLIRHDAGRSVLRDGRIEAAPQLSYETIDRWATVERFGGRVFLATSDTLHELHADLTVTPRAWPEAEGDAWEVIEAPGLGGALVRRRAAEALWFTADGRHYEPVENRTGAAPRAFGAELPDRAAMLAATTAGAALVSACP